MSGHDEDIDFDFFGETEPEPPKRRLVRRPSGPPPSGPPPPRRPEPGAPTATPIARLVSLIVFAIAMILILVFAVRSCEKSSESGAYKDYMNNVATIALDSKSVGKQLRDLLASQSVVIESQLETKLAGLVAQQNIDTGKGAKLTPPGPLRQQQEKLVEALQLRSDGLQGLLDVFKATATKHGTTAVTEAGLGLSQQMYKLVASDVIWADMFVAPAQKVLQDKGTTGVSPPSSIFLIDPDLASRGSMGAIWQRMHGVAPTSSTSGAGQHGTGIAYVKVIPSRQTLSEAVTTTIRLNTGNLSFVVGVENTGDYLEQNVKVTLTIHQGSKSIVKKETIGQILNGQTKEVVFKGPFALTDLINTVPINVEVTPVPGEASVTNNSYTYEVRFSY